MVQDMYDPEYYYEKYEIINTETQKKTLKNGKYSDTAQWEVSILAPVLLVLINCFFNDLQGQEEFNTHSTNSVLGERHTFVVITAPGKNTWVERVCFKKILFNKLKDYLFYRRRNQKR